MEEADQDQARAQGRDLDLDQALALALDLDMLPAHVPVRVKSLVSTRKWAKKSMPKKNQKMAENVDPRPGTPHIEL